MAVTSLAVAEIEAPISNDTVRSSVDIKSLPANRSRTGCWKSASFLMGVEVAKRFVYHGISSNLISYLTGPLSQSTVTAAENINAWNGTATLLLLLGAFIADSFLGRYRTIVIASLLYILCKRNPFIRIGRVFVKAAVNWNVSPASLCIANQAQPLLPKKDVKFKFLYKALNTQDNSQYRNICTVDDVEDAKAILRLVPIWFTCLGYAIVTPQISTLFTKQGVTLNRYITSTIQIPSVSLQCLISISIMVFIPTYDRLLVPFARSITKKPTDISMFQRIGIGIFLSFIYMVIAAIIEIKLLKIANKYGFLDTPNATLPMSVWWLAPQYLVCGIADVFTMVGLQEFFYDQVSKELKSVGLALYLSIFGIGNFLSSFLISVIEKATGRPCQVSWFSNNLNRTHLDYFYWLLAGISGVSLVVYIYFAEAYTYNRKGNF